MATPSGKPEQRSARVPADRVEVATGEAIVVPVVQEEVRIEKQALETGRTSIRISPTTHQESLSVELTDYLANIERVPVNRVVDSVAPVRQEGEVTIIPVYEEVVVMQKQLVLKEELRISRKPLRRTERQNVELRSEQVEVRRDTRP